MIDGPALGVYSCAPTLAPRVFSVHKAAHDTIRSYRLIDQGSPGMTGSPGQMRPRTLDIHAHVIVPEVYAVAAEHNIFSELPTDPGVTDEMRGKIKERAGTVLGRMSDLTDRL